MNPTVPHTPKSPRATVLVVEDEADLAELLREILQRQGYEVLNAQTGLHGLHLARRHLPDLILLDVLLGDMDGFSVCEILQSQPSTGSTPVILMTALAGEMARFNGFAAGAVAFLTKPISSRQLLRQVEASLAAANPPPQPPLTGAFAPSTPGLTEDR